MSTCRVLLRAWRVEKSFSTTAISQPYLRASHEQHEPKRRRRLLLHRLEIDKVAGAIEQAGRSLVALRMYWKNGRVKVELGLGKGKQDVDKRADLKKRVQEREVDRVLAGIQRKR